MTSILTCHFMLSLRQFDSAIVTATGVRGEHAVSSVLQFGAQPSDSLPGFIASFAHPVHLDSESDVFSEMDRDAYDDVASNIMALDGECRQESQLADSGS